MWWQLFCKKQALNWGQTCPRNALCFNMYNREGPASEFECRAPLWDLYRMAWLLCILCTVQMWLHSFFRNLSWYWREGDLVTSSQCKNSLLLYAVQTVEKMVDIFIRDTALEECPLCRSQYGCWSTTSIETSVYDVIYMHLECSWTWWLHKECSLIMWEHLKHHCSCQQHMKLNLILCGWASPMLETRIRGPCLMRDRGVQRLKYAPVEVLLLLVDGPPGRAWVVMAHVQHNVRVVPLSW